MCGQTDFSKEDVKAVLNESVNYINTTFEKLVKEVETANVEKPENLILFLQWKLNDHIHEMYGMEEEDIGGSILHQKMLPDD